MLRVGLTGGIACGKSSIAAMLVKRGAHFLQADGLAHQLYAPGTVTYGEIVRSFGREILNEDGTINRSKLADLVFPNRIHELNAIVHPEVVKRQNGWMSEVERSDPHGIAVVEAALLIEAGADQDFDKVIVVTCDFEQKVERFARRTSVPLPVARAEVERRSAAQFSDEEKARRADYIVDNSGSAEDAERQVEWIWRELQRFELSKGGESFSGG
jgi:dephospho-CoA kinase